MQQYFNKLSELSIKNAFVTIHLLGNKNDNCFSLILNDVKSACLQFSIDSTYVYFLQASINDFLQQGWLVNIGKALSITSSGRKILEESSINQISFEIQKLGKENPQLKCYVDLLFVCCTNTANILKGFNTPQEILFSDETLLPKIYGNNPIADVLHKEMKKFFQEAISKHKSSEPLKILEIGAGTGATTKFILAEVLKDFRLNWNYTFSDVSPHFIFEAQSSGDFDSNKFKFITLNLNKTNEFKQKLESYDIILGTNVLHACEDVKAVIKNLEPFLKENGCFIFGEITRVEAYLTYTFGLLKDWWQNNSQSYRLSNSPLLAIESWKKSFREIGLGEFNYSNSPQTPWQTAFCVSRQKLVIQNSDEILKKLQKTASEILVKPISEIEIDKNFAELGVDSLLVLTFIGKVHQEFGIKLRASDIFDYPTISKLAAYIKDKTQQVNLSPQAKPKVIQKSYSLSEFSYFMKNHRYKGQGLMPFDGWLKLITNLLEINGITPFSITEFYLLKPLFEDNASTIVIKVYPKESSTIYFGEIYSTQDGSKTKYAEFEIKIDCQLPSAYEISKQELLQNFHESEIFSSPNMEIGNVYKVIEKASYSKRDFICFF